MDFSQHFTYRRLIRSVLSTIIMMVFTSVYSVVDGLFVSNFVGKEAFAAVNFILPYLMFFNGIGFLFGTGGSALIAKTLGEGRKKKANEIFSSLVLVSVLTGVVFALLGAAFLRPVALWLGAKEELLRNSLLYGRIYLLGVPACVIQYEFQNLFPTAGKGKYSLYAGIASGVMNILLDGLFVAVFSWGLAGAAIATVLSQLLGGIIPIVYFGRPNTSELKLVKCRIDGRAMLKICSNGASEFVNNISMAVVSFVYNVQLLRYAGDDGIAAYGVLMYLNFMFTAIFWGYMIGVIPIISYHYGAENHQEVKSLLKKSLTLILTGSALMFTAAELLKNIISQVFVGYDPELLEMTIRGFSLFSFCFLFAGVAIFSSSFFTALNDGMISALVSFCRVFAFQIPATILLPMIWKLDGIWLSLVAADCLTCILGITLILAKRKKYQY